MTFDEFKSLLGGGELFSAIELLFTTELKTNPHCYKMIGDYFIQCAKDLELSGGDISTLQLSEQIERVGLNYRHLGENIKSTER